MAGPKSGLHVGYQFRSGLSGQTSNFGTRQKGNQESGRFDDLSPDGFKFGARTSGSARLHHRIRFAWTRLSALRAVLDRESSRFAASSLTAKLGDTESASPCPCAA